ncbi:hypothetical protein EI94DRAFT_1788983 [Lactarius quietus]|nr:hypothetical protein EI94DRAFT_1788983 [Lactarius quietus]
MHEASRWPRDTSPGVNAVNLPTCHLAQPPPNPPSWSLRRTASKKMPIASFQAILDTARRLLRADWYSPNKALKLLEEKANAFKPSRPAVHTLSGLLGQVVSVLFPPAQAIFAGVDVLLAAADGVTSSYDALVDLFECIGNFLKRLRIYTDLPMTPSMTDTIVNIMVELLAVFALATKQIKQGRFKKFAKKPLGESEIEAVLQRLDRLTQEESRMTVTQTLEVVHGLVNNVKVVMTDGKATTDGIRNCFRHNATVGE